MKKLFLVILVSIVSSISFGENVNIEANWVLKESNNFKKALQNFELEALNKCQASSINSSNDWVLLKESLKETFDLVMMQWQRLSVLSIKPILADNFKVSVQFFPDKKSRIKKKLMEYLRTEKKVDLSFVQGSIFYATGISALEMILFDEQESFIDLRLSHKEAFCGFVTNIPRHLYVQQEKFEGEFNSYINSISTEDFQDDLYNSILFSLEEIKKNKMDRQVNLETSKIFNKRFESYRSSNTLNNLKNNFKAQKDLLDLVFIPRLLKINDKESANMVNVLNEGYVKIIQDLDGFESDLVSMNASSKDYLHFEKLRNNSVVLLSIIKNQVAPKLKISIQFNGADGD